MIEFAFIFISLQFTYIITCHLTDYKFNSLHYTPSKITKFIIDITI
ncbi:hypothetical protein PPBDW_II1407 [Photobacterium kishitanii]|nr:hypothetical protein PPBDW_II1407 [Photobacterium kishitanii]